MSTWPMFLKQYLGDIAAIDLMSAEDEIRCANEIRRLREATWTALLDFPELVDDVLTLAATVLPAERMPKPPKASRNGRTSARDVQTLAVKLAAVDLDGDASDLVAAELELMTDPFTRSANLRLSLEQRTSAEYHHYLGRVRRSSSALRYARNAFVKANLRLVVKIAQAYANAELPLEDLIQEGNIGLMIAVGRFDASKGFRFSTYAGWWIRHTITRAIAKKGRTVRVPVYMKTTHARARKVRRELEAEIGRAATLNEVAERMQIDPHKLERTECAIRARSVSLEAPMPEEETLRLEERLASPDADISYDHLDSPIVERTLRRALDVLSPMEYDILTKRFGLHDEEGRTLREVGADYGLSRERIRQLQSHALGKLRGELEVAGIHSI